jgi:hypothetical protein
VSLPRGLRAIMRLKEIGRVRLVQSELGRVGAMMELQTEKVDGTVKGAGGRMGSLPVVMGSMWLPLSAGMDIHFEDAPSTSRVDDA